MPKYAQRLLRLNGKPGAEEITFSRSKTPNPFLISPSQNRSLPPVHTSHMLRPLVSSSLSFTPLSMASKYRSAAAENETAVRPARIASSWTCPGCGPPLRSSRKAAMPRTTNPPRMTAIRRIIAPVVRPPPPSHAPKAYAASICWRIPASKKSSEKRLPPVFRTPALLLIARFYPSKTSYQTIARRHGGPNYTAVDRHHAHPDIRHRSLAVSALPWIVARGPASP
jgi:hypothetical protein